MKDTIKDLESKRNYLYKRLEKIVDFRRLYFFSITVISSD